VTSMVVWIDCTLVVSQWKIDFVTFVCCSPLLSCGYFGSEAFLFIWFLRAADLGFACTNFGRLLPCPISTAPATS
jgi:hypothetical protein